MEILAGNNLSVFKHCSNVVISVTGTQLEMELSKSYLMINGKFLCRSKKDPIQEITVETTKDDKYSLISFTYNGFLYTFTPNFITIDDNIEIGRSLRIYPNGSYSYYPTIAEDDVGKYKQCITFFSEYGITIPRPICDLKCVGIYELLLRVYSISPNVINLTSDKLHVLSKFLSETPTWISNRENFENYLRGDRRLLTKAACEYLEHCIKHQESNIGGFANTSYELEYKLNKNMNNALMAATYRYCEPFRIYSGRNIYRGKLVIHNAHITHTKQTSVLLRFKKTTTITYYKKTNSIYIDKMLLSINTTSNNHVKVSCQLIPFATTHFFMYDGETVTYIKPEVSMKIESCFKVVCVIPGVTEIVRTMTTDELFGTLVNDYKNSVYDSNKAILLMDSLDVYKRADILVEYESSKKSEADIVTDLKLYDYVDGRVYTDTAISIDTVLYAKFSDTHILEVADTKQIVLPGIYDISRGSIVTMKTDTTTIEGTCIHNPHYYSVKVDPCDIQIVGTIPLKYYSTFENLSLLHSLNTDELNAYARMFSIDVHKARIVATSQTSIADAANFHFLFPRKLIKINNLLSFAGINITIISP